MFNIFKTKPVTPKEYLYVFKTIAPVLIMCPNDKTVNHHWIYKCM